MLIPVIATIIAIVASLSSYSLGAGWAIGLMVAVGMVTGIFSYLSSSSAFHLFLMIATFGLPVMAGSAALGIGAGLSLRDRKYFLAACLLAPFPFFLWKTNFTAEQKASEERMAMAYTVGNEQLIKLIGGPFEVYPASSTTYRDAGRGRYEYSIKGRDELYVIVDVFRDSDMPRFSIACVTTLSMGKREAGKDDCQQSTVALPGVPNARSVIPPEAAK